MFSNSKLVFVLGMHRSGTSALTGMLGHLGVHLGSNLMPANQSNIKGYFEDMDFVRFNETLLKSLGRNWHEILPINKNELLELENPNNIESASQLVINHVHGHRWAALKDPRLSILTPFWISICRKIGIKPFFIIALRNPEGVAQSLFARNNIPAAKTGWSWIDHTLSAALYTSGHPRIVVDYDRLTASPARELQRVKSFLSLADGEDDNFAEACKFIDRNLNHTQNAKSLTRDFDPTHIQPLARKLHEIMRTAACGEANLDDLGAHIRVLSEQFNSLAGLGLIYTEAERKVAGLQASAQEAAAGHAKITVQLRDQMQKAAAKSANHVSQLQKGIENRDIQIRRLKNKSGADHRVIQQLRAENKRLARKIHSVEASLSWRMTKALRWIADYPRLSILWRGLRMAQSMARLPATYRLLTRHNLFDAGYYLGQNPDVAKRGMRPMLHYLLFGWREARSPHPMFNAFWYLWMNPSLRKGRDHPLIHYCKKGAKTGKLPRIHFDTGWYGDQFPESGKSGSNPLFHYVSHGLPAVRKFIEKTGIFDAAFYSQKYPDIPATRQDPFEHFLKFGLWEHRDPSTGFCHAFYLHEYPEVKTLDLPPFLHFAWLGHRLGYNGVAQDNHPTPGDIQRAQEALRNAPITPFFSVIMPTWNRGNIIKRAVDSVLDQSYQHYEIIIIDDGSTDDTLPLLETEYRDQMQTGNIRIISSAHVGVSTARNLGLQAAKGNWIAYLDSDNKWREHYLLFNAAAIIAQPDTQTLYSEIRVNDRTRGFQYVRRKTFSWADLYKANFIDLNIYCHHIDLFNELGGFDEQLTRLVDWDLILRQTAKHRPVLIPFTLTDYFLCSSLSNITHREDITANNNVVRSKFASQTEHIMADERRLENTRMFDWEKMAKDASQREKGLTSIIIPFVNNAELALKCLDSIRRYTPASKYEVILVDNASSPSDANSIAKHVADKPEIKMVRNSTNLNYALGNNVGFSHSKGEYLVLLNNDTEVTVGWLKELISPLREDDDIGATGPKLLYGDGTVQCAGLVFNDKSKVPYHIYRNEPGDAPYVNKKRGFQALTGACFAMRSIDFARLNGFSAAYINGCEDLDLCFRITHELGKRLVLCPSSMVYHHEGKTPGRSKHIGFNRHLFVDYWRKHIKPDDSRIYRQDGFCVIDYHKPGNEPHGELAAYVPLLSNDSINNPSPNISLSNNAHSSTSNLTKHTTLGVGFSHNENVLQGPANATVSVACESLLSSKPNILVIKPSGIGNMIMFRPAMRALREHLPDSRVTVMCYNHEVDAINDLVNDVIILRNKDPETGGVSKDEIDASILPGTFDVALYPPFTNLSRPTPHLLTAIKHHITHPNIDFNNKHEVEHNLDVIRLLGWNGTCPPMTMQTDSSLCDKYDLPELLIGIHCGASSSSHMQKKKWPTLHWVKLIELLPIKYSIAIVGGPGEINDTTSLLEKLNPQRREKTIVFTGLLTLHETASVIKKCRLFVSNDSGLMHIASAVMTPVIGVFGPTLPVKNAPWGDPKTNRHINAQVPCGPCYGRPGNPLNSCNDQICLKRISPQRVANLAISMLSSDV